MPFPLVHSPVTGRTDGQCLPATTAWQRLAWPGQLGGQEAAAAGRGHQGVASISRVGRRRGGAAAIAAASGCTCASAACTGDEDSGGSSRGVAAAGAGLQCSWGLAPTIRLSARCSRPLHMPGWQVQAAGRMSNIVYTHPLNTQLIACGEDSSSMAHPACTRRQPIKLNLTLCCMSRRHVVCQTLSSSVPFKHCISPDAQPSPHSASQPARSGRLLAEVVLDARHQLRLLAGHRQAIMPQRLLQLGIGQLVQGALGAPALQQAGEGGGRGGRWGGYAAACGLLNAAPGHSPCNTVTAGPYSRTLPRGFPAYTNLALPCARCLGRTLSRAPPLPPALLLPTSNPPGCPAAPPPASAALRPLGLPPCAWRPPSSSAAGGCLHCSRGRKPHPAGGGWWVGKGSGCGFGCIRGCGWVGAGE